MASFVELSTIVFFHLGLLVWGALGFCSRQKSKFYSWPWEGCHVVDLFCPQLNFVFRQEDELSSCNLITVAAVTETHYKHSNTAAFLLKWVQSSRRSIFSKKYLMANDWLPFCQAESSYTKHLLHGNALMIHDNKRHTSHMSRGHPGLTCTYVNNQILSCACVSTVIPRRVCSYMSFMWITQTTDSWALEASLSCSKLIFHSSEAGFSAAAVSANHCDLQHWASVSNEADQERAC